MRTLTHHHLACALNRRAQIERENAPMEEIEHRAMPLMYAVLAAALATVLWIATADYCDVVQHKLNTLADRQQYERISAKLASCANSGTTTFDGAVLQCERIELVRLK